MIFGGAKMIEALNLCKKFDGTTVLDNLNCHVARGSVYGLIGSNGAGKSTLLNILSGVYKPDGGSAKILDAEIFENTCVKSKTAYIGDDPFFYNSATTEEMAKVLCNAYKDFTMERFYEVAALFPIDIKKRINTFSKGMRRQVAIILALAQNPEILLCDESFDGLDPVIRQLVKRIIVSEVEKNQLTVLISSHNLREMENLCDTIGVLHDNKIIIERSIDNIKSSLHKLQLAFKPMIETSEIKGIEVLSVNTRGNIMELVARGDIDEITASLQNLNPIIIDKLDLSLEDIFIYEMEVKGYDFSKILL
jgi:ABC-2 type transport system ATP-binding protein